MNFQNPYTLLNSLNSKVSALRNRGGTTPLVIPKKDETLGINHYFGGYYPLSLQIPMIEIQVMLPESISIDDLATRLINREQEVIQKLSLKAQGKVLVFAHSSDWTYGAEPRAKVYRKFGAYIAAGDRVHFLAPGNEFDVQERVECRRADRLPVPQLMRFSPIVDSAEVWPSEANQYRAEYPDRVWFINPYTGEKRTPANIDVDPYGLLIDLENPITGTPLPIAEHRKIDPLKVIISRADSYLHKDEE